MWAREMTVVETYQGSPSTDMSSISIATQKRSRWKPAPFCRWAMRMKLAQVSPLGWEMGSLEPTLRILSLGPGA